MKSGGGYEVGETGARRPASDRENASTAGATSTTRFQRVWRCWSCGARLPNGELLDCAACQKMLDDAQRSARARAWLIKAVCYGDDLDIGPLLLAYRSGAKDANARITACINPYAESDGVIEELRKELEGICL